MSGCTAPIEGHNPGSKQEADCPAHGAAARNGRPGQQHDRQAGLAAPAAPGASRGRAAIEALIADRKLELVQPDARLAAMQLDQARESLDLAAEQSEMRPEASLTLAYDAARKVVVAMLEAQGLRARMPNAHANVQDALRAQWGGSLADRFGAARKARHRAEYPSESTMRATPSSAVQTVALAEELFRLAEDQMPSLLPFPH